MSPVESAAVREKRLELHELETAKDFWGPDAYEAMRQSLLEDLAELQGQTANPIPKPKPETPMPAKPLNTLTEEQKEARRKYHRDWKAKQRAEKGVKPKAPKKARAPKPDPAPRESLERPLEIAIDLGRAIEREVSKPTPLAEVRTRLRGIRRQVWLLMADIESLPAPQLAELTSELEVLESATHQAHQLALRAEEVA